ncbi:hypothetical protein RHMOL_Rhmol13G0054600 [Rhododendron molle]|uniref:Uncharacterized protein n=1 Tax=Rhododendron molle TaxID=49168 RepID=A0ACC0L4D9_RHOML|nr:hypothetical protein RHMOL_Rhmol13G0054600 [Rhododendron molle]
MLQLSKSPIKSVTGLQISQNSGPRLHQISFQHHALLMLLYVLDGSWLMCLLLFMTSEDAEEEERRR